MLAKVGSLWPTDTRELGVTVTTPRLTLLGSGSVGLFNGQVDQARSTARASSSAPRPNTSFTRRDLMHVSTGTTLRISKSDSAIGVDDAFGSEDEIAVIPPGIPDLRNPIVADGHISSLSFLPGCRLVF